jgi:hypothetical protein
MIKCDCINIGHVQDAYIVVDTASSRIHTHVTRSSLVVSAVLEAVHGANVVLTDEEPSDDTSLCSPRSPSRLDGPPCPMPIFGKTSTPDPCVTPPRGGGTSPYVLSASQQRQVSHTGSKLPPLAAFSSVARCGKSVWAWRWWRTRGERRNRRCDWQRSGW